jgi:hypothetical protein
LQAKVVFLASAIVAFVGVNGFAQGVPLAVFAPSGAYYPADVLPHVDRSWEIAVNLCRSAGQCSLQQRVYNQTLQDENARRACIIHNQSACQYYQSEINSYRQKMASARPSAAVRPGGYTNVGARYRVHDLDGYYAKVANCLRMMGVGSATTPDSQIIAIASNHARAYGSRIVTGEDIQPDSESGFLVGSAEEGRYKACMGH